MNVVIVQRRLTHYRVPLFEAVRNKLLSRGIRLRLLVGRGTAEEVEKNDAGELDWAETVPTRYFFGGRLCWQSFGSKLSHADLIVLTQENRLVQNLLFLLGSRKPKVAFWGHGANLQSRRPHGLREAYKRHLSTMVDWWFAYTELSRDLIAANGFPDGRITVLNNAVDTIQLQRDLASINDAERERLIHELGFVASSVALFIGSLYGDKRLGFLFAAADRIKAELPDFELLIVGDGPMRNFVREWCDERPWAKWVGSKFGREKALYMSLAKVNLNPGLVGLGLLDAFAGGLPTITTKCDLHSPEIAYLHDEVNGIVTDDDLPAYVAAATRLLGHEIALAAMRLRCLQSAGEITVERMAERFADGIERALGRKSFVGA